MWGNKKWIQVLNIISDESLHGESLGIYLQQFIFFLSPHFNVGLKEKDELL